MPEPAGAAVPQKGQRGAGCRSWPDCSGSGSRRCAQSGAAARSIRRIERGAGAPSFDTIQAIATALEVTYAELFTEAPPQTPEGRLAAAVEGLDEAAVRRLITGARLLRRAARS
jgi:transcriptional regulator with XRE-family HTH domain